MNYHVKQTSAKIRGQKQHMWTIQAPNREQDM